MPLIKLTITKEISEDEKKDLARLLTEITVEILNKKINLTVTNIETKSADDWFIGGKSLPTEHPCIASLSIKVTQGTNSDEEKYKWIKSAWDILAVKLGNLTEPSYIVIEELPSTNWGYNGLTQKQRMDKTNEK